MYITKVKDSMEMKNEKYLHISNLGYKLFSSSTTESCFT